MFASVIAPGLARRGIHYGWVMVAITFLTMLATGASMGLPGVLQNPLHDEFRWSFSQIAGPLSLRLALFGLVAPFAAALIARYGIRTVTCVALSLMVVGLLLSSQMSQLWHLWLGWGLLLGLTSGMTALVLGATVANRWFVRRRGLVVGLLTASNATGQLIFMPLAAWLSQHQGWRMALIPAIAACATCFVLMLLLARDHPSELGLPALGEREVAPPAPPAGNAAWLSLSVLREAAGKGAFWILFGTIFVCGLSTNGLIQNNFIPLCHDFGLDAVVASGVLATIGAFDFVGTIGSGWLSDRVDNRWLLFWYYGLRGLSLMLLPYTDFSLWGLSLFAVFYGLDWVATVPPTVRLAAGVFGREKAAIVFGWVFAGHQLGAATATQLASLSRDVLASYLPAFFGAGVMCLVAAAAVMALRRTPSPRAPGLRPAAA